MTKAALIDQVLLAVSGGEFSPDVKVDRADIANLLPAAINYAIVMYSRQERKDTIEEIKLLGSAGGAMGKINQEFFVTKKLTPIKDDERDLFYIALPFKIQALPGNRGLDSVFPKQGDGTYIKVASHYEVVGLDGKVCFFWLEKYDAEQRIYFKNIGFPVCDHFVKVVVSVDGLADGDELPMPGDFEFQVIELLVKFFREQRDGGADDKPDDKDNT